MNFFWRIASIFCIAGYASPQEPPSKSRDLKYEENRPAAPSATIPRGYALVVGVAKYKNLPAKDRPNGLSDGHFGRGSRLAGPGETEGSVDRLLPQRRDCPGCRGAKAEQEPARSLQLDVFAHGEPGP